MARACLLRPGAAVGGIACVAAILLAGCTMCPDPYDYSGPVPNGSAPQNDFRARSQGIEPIGVAPRPWPPLVKRQADSGPDAIAAASPPATAIPEVVPEGQHEMAAALQAAAR